MLVMTQSRDFFQENVRRGACPVESPVTEWWYNDIMAICQVSKVKFDQAASDVYISRMEACRGQCRFKGSRVEKTHSDNGATAEDPIYGGQDGRMKDRRAPNGSSIEEDREDHCIYHASDYHRVEAPQRSSAPLYYSEAR